MEGKSDNDVPDQPKPPPPSASKPSSLRTVDGDATVNKKRKPCELEGLIVECDKSGILPFIKEGLRSLCEDARNAIASLIITSCNGNTRHGVPFSMAFCDTELSDEKFYPFGIFFTSGIELVYKCLSDTSFIKKIEERQEIMMSKLLRFFLCDESVSFLNNLDVLRKKYLDNETRVSVAVAEHLLKMLSVSEMYTVDDRCHRTREDAYCQCGCKTPVEHRYQDLSIGDPRVWHGDLDVIIGQGMQQTPVVVAGNLMEEDENEDGNRLSTPVENQFKNLQDIDHQIIAETIVFSFFQKCRFPKSKHSLVPCIGICPTEVVFFFYDAELDVLLQSLHMSLQTAVNNTINYSAVIAIWLVLNHQYLGSGLVKGLTNIPKCNFHTLSSTVLDVYKNDLSMGKIHEGSIKKHFGIADISAMKFVWDEDIFPKFEFDRV